MGTEEMSAGEGEPGRAADPLPRQALCLPASVGSPAWRRRRNSRAANLSKEMWQFLGTARTSEVSLLEKARERRTETCDSFRPLHGLRLFFSSIQRLFRVAQHQQLRPLPHHYLLLAATLLPPNTLSPWGDTSCPLAQGERVPPFANRSHAW